MVCSRHHELYDTTLNRWAKLITPSTLEALHERVVQLACERKVTQGRKLRVNSAAVETSIDHLTDSSLVADGVRVLSRHAAPPVQIMMWPAAPVIKHGLSRAGASLLELWD